MNKFTERVRARMGKLAAAQVAAAPVRPAVKVKAPAAKPARPAPRPAVAPKVPAAPAALPAATAQAAPVSRPVLATKPEQLTDAELERLTSPDASKK